MQEETFRQWAILELMGHRRLAGRVSEEMIAGASFVRIDIPRDDSADDYPQATQFYSPQAVYCITPTGEATARACAKSWTPTPVARWELAAGEPATDPATDDEEPSPCDGF